MVSSFSTIDENGGLVSPFEDPLAVCGDSVAQGVREFFPTDSDVDRDIFYNLFPTCPEKDSNETEEFLISSVEDIISRDNTPETKWVGKMTNHRLK